MHFYQKTNAWIYLPKVKFFLLYHVSYFALYTDYDRKIKKNLPSLSIFFCYYDFALYTDYDRKIK